MDVVIAVITAKGEIKMSTSIIEEAASSQAPDACDQPKAQKKASAAKRGAHVAFEDSSGGCALRWPVEPSLYM
jgi:hypothetical protein